MPVDFTYLVTKFPQKSNRILQLIETIEAVQKQFIARMQIARYLGAAFKGHSGEITACQNAGLRRAGFEPRQEPAAA